MAPPPVSDTLRNQRLRFWELWVLFVAFPIGLFFIRDHFARWIVPTLLITSAACSLILLRDPTFDRRRFGLATPLGQGLAMILRRFIPGALAITLLLVIFRPELLFSFPRREPFWWAVVMVAYPLLSVYPQEILFRTFFFHRYRHLLTSERIAVLWSAAVFGLAHLFFANWIAPTLTAAGGYLFARTYARTGSTLLVTLEHALWGDFLFTIGLGSYFFGGSIRDNLG
ncbi:MAG: CPBP family intramembrane glutamic endopeptidase [Acidobacteriota bacterium]